MSNHKLVFNAETQQNEVVENTAHDLEIINMMQTIENQRKAEIDAQAQAKATAQANGNQKLLDLGLTQAEATALTGYTPPVAE